MSPAIEKAVVGAGKDSVTFRKESPAICTCTFQHTYHTCNGRVTVIGTGSVIDLGVFHCLHVGVIDEMLCLCVDETLCGVHPMCMEIIQVVGVEIIQVRTFGGVRL